jgi:hypothetical protein
LWVKDRELKKLRGPGGHFLRGSVSYQLQKPCDIGDIGDIEDIEDIEGIGDIVDIEDICDLP